MKPKVKLQERVKRCKHGVLIAFDKEGNGWTDCWKCSPLQEPREKECPFIDHHGKKPCKYCGYVESIPPQPEKTEDEALLKACKWCMSKQGKINIQDITTSYFKRKMLKDIMNEPKCNYASSFTPTKCVVHGCKNKMYKESCFCKEHQLPSEESTKEWEDKVRNWANANKVEVGAKYLLICFIKDLLEAQQQQLKKEIKKKIKKMKKETCDCENSMLGYHTKDCDFTPYGYNEALNDILNTL